jgi:hypothetical protein
MPRGGLSFWIELPESVSQGLFQMTLREGLTLLPSSEFNIHKNNESNLRLPIYMIQIPPGGPWPYSPGATGNSQVDYE